MSIVMEVSGEVPVYPSGECRSSRVSFLLPNTVGPESESLFQPPDFPLELLSSRLTGLGHSVCSEVVQPKEGLVCKDLCAAQYAEG